MGIWKFVGIQDNYPKIVVTMDEIEGVSYQDIKQIGPDVIMVDVP